MKGPTRPEGALPLCDYPNVYDAAFSWDRTREASTFLEKGRSLRKGTVSSAVELGCGTGAIARILAGQGLTVFGIDKSRASVARANALSKGIVSRPTWIVGDLRTFRLPRKVDLAVAPLDGLSYLVESQDIIKFFRSVARSLTPQGVFAADLTLHPEGGQPLHIRNSWKVKLRPRGALSASWQSQGAAWGSPRRQWEVGRISVRAPDGSRQLFWEASPHACLSIKELNGLADTAGGFSQMKIFSDSAHRAREAEPRQVDPSGKLIGPHLVAWVCEK